jgi:hypothetical protein
MLSPIIFSIEDAAGALPGILRELTRLHAEENDLGDPAGLRLLECTLAGWSEAEDRMRLWQFLSAEDYSPHDEFDAHYGGPYPIPPLNSSFFPLDRAADTLETKLIGILHAHDRFCAEHPEIAGGVRLGGEIALTTVTEHGISHRIIGCFSGDETRREDDEQDDAPVTISESPAALRPIIAAQRKKTSRRKAERKARKVTRNRR